MEELSRLVDASLAKHGVEAGFDHLLIQWSRWFRCESSLSMLLVAAQPGIFVLAEEVAFTADLDQPRSSEGERHVLDVFHVGEAEDLGLAVGRWFLPGSPVRERLVCGRSFARYAVIADRAERSLALTLFRRWMESDEVAADSGDQPTKALAGSHPRGESFIIRFPLDQVSRARKGQAADRAWSEAKKVEARARGLAASRLPSGF